MENAYMVRAEHATIMEAAFAAEQYTGGSKRVKKCRRDYKKGPQSY